VRDAGKKIKSHCRYSKKIGVLKKSWRCKEKHPP